MSLDHAILGFLGYRPMSGYDLKSVFDASVKHFWPADQSQIYRTLSRLTDNGWLEVEVIEQNDRPDRKVYHITEPGREELLKWLTSPLPSEGKRIRELVQVFFVGHVSDEEALALFKRLADHCRNVIARLEALPCDGNEHGEAELSYRDRFFMNLTLDYGIKLTQANLDWLEGVISMLELGEHRKGSC